MERGKRGGFFPKLRQLLGPQKADVLPLLKEQHQEFRESLKRLARLLQAPGLSAWEEILQDGREFIDLLGDHEAKEERLLLEVFELSLEPQELNELARSFQQTIYKEYAQRL